MDIDERVDKALIHYGVKGQQWGVRTKRPSSGVTSTSRATKKKNKLAAAKQNAELSKVKAGAKYDKAQAKLSIQKIKNDSKSAKSKLKTDLAKNKATVAKSKADVVTSNNTAKRVERLDQRSKVLSVSGSKHATDGDLKAAVSRKDTEAKYKKALQPKRSQAKKIVSTVITASAIATGSVLLKPILEKYGSTGINKASDLFKKAKQTFSTRTVAKDVKNTGEVAGAVNSAAKGAVNSTAKGAVKDAAASTTSFADIGITPSMMSRTLEP